MRISIIGAGNMGSSIASALSSGGYEVSVYDTVREKSEALCSAHPSIKALSSIDEASGSDVVIIAVKPQVLPSLYMALREIDTDLWISIVAGVPLSALEDHLGTDTVVRFMPNIAARSMRSVTAIAAGSGVMAEDKEKAIAIASSFGSAYLIPEELFPAFIGISGSGIAYILEMMHHMAMGGVKEGIPYPEALSIVRDTMFSASSLQKESGRNAVDLECMVCSAAGTTIEGVRALQDGGFASSVMEAVERASEKSRELEAKASR